MSLGTRIRNFRKERGITLTQLAKKLDVSPSFLSAVERDIKKPSVIMLHKISSHLNISPSYLTATENKYTGEKVRIIRKQRGLNLEDLAELSELPVKDIDNIENNMLNPSIEQLEKLSSALNVTIQYFLDSQTKKSNLGKKINHLRKKLNLSQAELAHAAKISPALISQIENNTTMPSLNTLEKIAECLDVETSYFMVDFNTTIQHLSSLSPELVSLLNDPKVLAILTTVRDLEPGELKFVLSFLEFFKMNRKHL